MWNEFRITARSQSSNIHSLATLERGADVSSVTQFASGQRNASDLNFKITLGRSPPP
jgi:hypothetical protein